MHPLYHKDNVFILLEAAIETRNIALEHYNAEKGSPAARSIWAKAHDLVNAISGALPPIIIQVAGRNPHDVVSDIVEASRKLHKEIELPEVMLDGEYSPYVVEHLISDLDDAGLYVKSIQAPGSFLQELIISRHAL